MLDSKPSADGGVRRRADGQVPDERRWYADAVLRTMTLTLSPPAAGIPVPDDDSVLLRRVSGEFQEMPDLTVTLAQAARLFAVDLPRCRRILDLLVAGGVLSTDGRFFARAMSIRRPRVT